MLTRIQQAQAYAGHEVQPSSLTLWALHTNYHLQAVDAAKSRFTGWFDKITIDSTCCTRGCFSLVLANGMA
jgi:hypothetical protein